MPILGPLPKSSTSQDIFIPHSPAADLEDFHADPIQLRPFQAQGREGGCVIPINQESPEVWNSSWTQGISS